MKNSDRLRAWLEHKLADGDPGERLPATDELSRRFGLSARSIHVLLRPYVQSGRLERMRGKGTFLPRATNDEQWSPAIAVSSVASVVDRLNDAISRGDYKTGEALPAISFMSARFGVSPSTVSRAYRLLASRGRVFQLGRTYWVGSLAQAVVPAEGKRVVLLRVSPAEAGAWFAGDWCTEAYHRMERVLSSSGFTVDYHDSAELHDLVAHWEHTGPIPYGLIFYRGDRATYEQSVYPHLHETFGRWRRLGRALPRVLYDLQADRIGKPLPGLLVFHRGNVNTSASRTVAAWLTSRKYRSIVIFQEGPFEPVYDPWHFGGVQKIYAEAMSLNTRADYRFCVHPRYPFLSAQSFLEARTQRLAPEALSAKFAKYPHLSPGKLAERITLCSDIMDTLRDFRDADLWVFQTTRRASQALAWCRAEHIDVPRRLSILSLENDMAYCHEGITCCEVDWDNIGYLMAHAIIGDFPVARTSQGYLRCAANVIERRTTA